MSNEYPDPNHPDNTSDSDPRLQSSKPVNAPTTQPNAANELQDVKKELSGYEQSTLRWTVVILLVNAFTCLFIGLQWYEIHSGSRDTHTLAEAAKKQADKMSNMSDAARKISEASQDMVGQDQRIADNAQKSLYATIQQAEITQRAWVYVTVHPGTPEHFAAGRSLDIRITTKNSGRTPALRVRSAMYRTTIPKSMSPDLSLRWHTFDKKDYVLQGNVNPDSSDYSDLVYNLTEEDVKRIDNMDVRIYVYGRVEYEDVFGTPHWTTFCTFLLGGGDFGMCSNHNDADNNQPSNPSPKPN